jgi:two-component system, OmpR family, phosphate regulon response regulator PhoB
MTSQTILVVEDDEAIRDMVVFNLDRAGFRALTAGTCQEARVRIADDRPDLILLDWMLPDMSGVELARSLRRDELTRELPIVMLTARAMEDDKVRGLDSGVDDYVTKPFGARELIARINAVLRRTQPGGVDDEIEADGLTINVASHRVLANGKPIELGPTEYRMLKFFMTHPDRVYSRTQLLDHVWGSGVYVEERTVDVHILRLRKALASHGFDRYVQTVRGAGYRFSVTADD